MKKTIITLLTLAGVAVGADLTIQNDTTETLSNADNIYYGDNVTLNVESAISTGQLQFISGTDITAITLNFTEAGSISCSKNWWMTSDSGTVESVNFGFVLTSDAQDDFISKLDSVGSYTQQLISYSQSWEVDECFDDGKISLTLSDNLTSLGYTVVTGNITSLDDLKPGEVGLGQYNTDKNGTDNYKAPVMLYIKAVKTSNIPEPTTATLSLLALAGLAARRRRK